MHTSSSMQAARRLIGAHVPFRVLTKKSLSQLADVKLLVLSSVNMMDNEEAAAIRAWVRSGGTLLASGSTSLIDKNGHTQPDFMLADVLGVTIAKAAWQDQEHYVAPTPAGAKFFPQFSAEHPPFVIGPTIEVRATGDSQVLATTTWPWPAPDVSRFSSIHSNPPWQPTKRPEIVLNNFERGRAIYTSSLIENVDGMSDTYLALVRMLAGPLRFELDAPAAVEMTIFDQPDRHRYLLSLVNFQRELPNIPIENTTVRVRLPEGTLRRVVRLPDNQVLEHRSKDDAVEFSTGRLETLAMFALETA
jgi:hypothetical protein